MPNKSGKHNKITQKGAQWFKIMKNHIPVVEHGNDYKMITGNANENILCAHLIV